ncbi:hypothetical protein RI129_010672 [Pyrocoelia pectoralis]|uniref:AMP-dependent synthetase/ligase domain-containing protein n=1 Tax=Pyrocoelia pectoralis TaxID=417401 RepID=A0AAN7ZGQ0_9COLE
MALAPTTAFHVTGTPTNNIIIMPDPPMITDQRGIGHVYFESMLKYREKIAQVDGHTGEEETYESLLKRSIRTAITMQNMGIKPGDFVSMCTVNDMDACVVYIASLFIGAVMANVDVNVSTQDIVFLLKQVSPKIIFATPNSESVIQEVIRELGGHITLVVFGETELNSRFTDFTRRYENEDKFKPREVDNLEEIAFVIFSSGTTDRPKGICHSHLAMVSYN